MASGPELFVVCKKCNSEVSPYITECPYCGTRLRKRAPKLDKGGTPRAAEAPRERPKLSRLKPGEIPGVRGRPPPLRDDLAGRSSRSSSRCCFQAGHRAVRYLDDVVATSPLDGEYWKLVTQLFVYYNSTGYEIAALGAIFLFGWLLERRHGAWAPLLVFFLGGVAGSALVLALDPNGGDARRQLRRRSRCSPRGRCATSSPAAAARRTTPTCSACSRSRSLLVLLPVASVEPHSLAGLGGGVTGIVLGLFLARLPQR